MTAFQERNSDVASNLSRNPVTRDVLAAEDEEAIVQHLDLLLLQDPFACIGRPFACAGLRRMVFEDTSDVTKEEVRARVKEALRQEPRILTKKIDVEFEDRFLKIAVEFSFVDSGRNSVYETRLRRTI